MEVNKLIKKGNAVILIEWIKKHSDKEYATLLDKAEADTRKKLNLR
ncbi:MAG: hypothetical protein U9O96_00755 [Candidatus Thermoplasmatota archaeon]|nr:hypothetical protein [Candidatus Thermoplasmatota archaeon]